MSVEQISPVLIIGTGLIGASIGQALSRAGAEVFLHDADRAHAMVAASRGAGLVAEPRPGTVKLVVVAVPPAAIPQVVAESLERYPRSAVTDCGSVKLSILDKVSELAPDASRYLGSHPMAGSQYAGPLTAIGELFADRTWVLTPSDNTPDWVRARVHTMAQLCGARVVYLDARAHDRAVAEVSHLPQLMSSLTAARLADVPQEDLLLAGQGVRDVTRIAASDPVLWEQIVSANQTELLAQLRGVQADLAALIDGLENSVVVDDLLRRGNAGVHALPGKHGKQIDLVDVVVEIPDTPGALAKLFTAIEDRKINIEDISIEHDPVKEIGFLAIEVEPDRAEPLRKALSDDGWRLRG